MTSEWPIKADDRVRAPRSPGALPRIDAPAERLRDATTDLFLPSRHRISDRLRASASVMRDGVVAAVERDMRLLLVPQFQHRAELSASLASASVAIALPLLADAQALRCPPLVAILLRRADAFVLAQRLLPPGTQPAGLPIDDADEAIAAAAMALLIAGSRRIDRFGEPALLIDDLPAELAHWLVWQIAAALRHYMRVHHAIGDREADRMLSAAAGSILGAHDEERGLDVTAARLAARLAAADRIDGAALGALLSAGQVPAFIAALAAVTDLPQDEVWHMVGDPVDARLAFLLRAAGVERDAAAAILLLLVDNDTDAAAEIERFDRCDRAGAQEVIAPLMLEPQYRAAIAAIDAALAYAGAGL